ncbi:hypothetical protein [Iningainema tapete]|uniref:Uncharacterized protein n=1 Tax=Iningainema tapete BLCC-T55 TaxID=2748662 RepID=A0A8J7C712_9CYAN|nr:hypothetical protein [Iningainema tapete]MBD2772621.1 hypothetical protein [Iningainema tapete BLCC-T55]
MTYCKQLHPWCIIRTLDNKERIVVARFRRRDDAVAYLSVLRQQVKNVKFLIFFDNQTKRKPDE